MAPFRSYVLGLATVPGWLLACGLVAVALVMALMLAAQRARRRVVQLERENAALGLEVERRERDQEALRAEVERRQRSVRELQQAAEELQRSNRELEEFAMVASHDLRAPLNKVRGFAELLEEHHGAQLDEEARDYVQRMRRSAERMQHLIEDLLMLARVRSDSGAFARVDLSAVLNEVLAELDAPMRQVGGRVESGSLPAIEADPVQMHQLLQNLLDNGLKFRHRDRPPLVRVSGQILRGGMNGHANAAVCQLRITDNGIGFDNRSATKIFRPFERLHGSQAYSGSGMGLAVCARIAERHGGTIVATGTPGEGATFVVTLPVHHDQAPREEELQGVGAHGRD